MAIRSKNFNQNEIELIICMMEEYPELVSGEFTPRLPSKKEHKEQWDVLAKKLSFINMGIPRTGAQVKNKWGDLKYWLRQKAIKIKKEKYSTGGGPQLHEFLLPHEQRLLSIIGKRCAEGIMDESSDTSSLILQKLKNKSSARTLSQRSEENNLVEVMVIHNATSARPQQCEVDNLAEVMVIDSATSALPQNCDINNLVEVIDNEMAPESQTSWPISNSRNSSTLRSQKRRLRKRKIAATGLENFEAEALKNQKEMSTQVQNLAINVATLVPSVVTQQNDMSDIKNILLLMNKNIEILITKMDENNKLLKLVLNDDL